MGSADAIGLETVLDETQILACNRQYDIELVYHVNLSQMGFTSLGNAFQRCYALTTLDLSRNMLRSLSGIQPVAATLVFLNASENHIENVIHLRGFSQLERLWIEGNELASKASVAPLAELKGLREICLRRVTSNTPSGGSSLSLALDNPICKNSKEYSLLCQEFFPHVRFIDGNACWFDMADRVPALNQLTTFDEGVTNFKKTLERIKREACREFDDESRLLGFLKTNPV